MHYWIMKFYTGRSHILLALGSKCVELAKSKSWPCALLPLVVCHFGQEMFLLPAVLEWVPHPGLWGAGSVCVHVRERLAVQQSTNTVRIHNKALQNRAKPRLPQICLTTHQGLTLSHPEEISKQIQGSNHTYQLTNFQSSLLGNAKQV